FVEIIRGRVLKRCNDGDFAIGSTREARKQRPAADDDRNSERDMTERAHLSITTPRKSVYPIQLRRGGKTIGSKTQRILRDCFTLSCLRQPRRGVSRDRSGVNERTRLRGSALRAREPVAMRIA